MKILNCEQNSPEWYMARLGKITASSFDKIITKTMRQSSQAEEVINKCVAELIIGEPEELFISDDMMRGQELEEEAAMAFQLIKSIPMQKIGLIDSEKGYSCSPDMLGEYAGLEIKCPKAHNHVAYTVGQKLPDKYKAQVQGSMLISGYKSWFFMSYHPNFQPFIIEVERDDIYCAKLKEYLEASAALIQERLEKFKNIEIDEIA